jgi:hypothetical protein
MDSKTKAKELINKFHPHCGGAEPMQTENAKKCALLQIQAQIDMIQPYIYLPSASDIWDELMDIKYELENYEA